MALEKVVGSEASTRAYPIRRKTGSLPVELAGHLSLSLPFPLPLPLLLHLCLHPYLSLSPQLRLAMNEEKHWPNGSLTMRKTSLSVYAASWMPEDRDGRNHILHDTVKTLDLPNVGFSFCRQCISLLCEPVWAGLSIAHS